jgi:hypothetical protein
MTFYRPITRGTSQNVTTALRLDGEGAQLRWWIRDEAERLAISVWHRIHTLRDARHELRTYAIHTACRARQLTAATPEIISFAGNIADSELRDAYVRMENVFDTTFDDAYLGALVTRRDGRDRSAALQAAQQAARNATLAVPTWIIEAAADLANRDWLLEQCDLVAEACLDGI